jgi:hypothetical protein
MKVILEASREIDYGRIIVNFAGAPSNVVDIVAEKHIRFRHEKTAEPLRGNHTGIKQGCRSADKHTTIQYI